mgnify:FL=1|jgi:hypothetical protein
MKKIKLDDNQMSVILQLKPDGEVLLAAGHCLTQEFLDEDEIDSALNLLQGMLVLIKEHPDFVSNFGAMFRELTEMWGEEFGPELSLDQEPTPTDKVKKPAENGNVFHFAKRMMH